MKSLSYYIKALNADHGTDKAKYAIHCNKTITGCDYFWSTVYALVSILWFLLIAIIIIGVMGVVLLSPFIAAFSGATGIMFDWMNYEVVVELSFIAAAVLAVFGFIGFCTGKIDFWPDWLRGDIFIYRQLDKILPESKPKPVKVKEPGIISIWYRGFKDKVCPIIDMNVHGKE
jgi:hypothetical protein